MHEAESNKTVSSIILEYTGGKLSVLFEVLKSENWASISLFYRNALKHSEERFFFTDMCEKTMIEVQKSELMHDIINCKTLSLLLLYTTKTFSPKSTRKQYSVCVHVCVCFFAGAIYIYIYIFNFFICFTAKTKNVIIMKENNEKLHRSYRVYPSWIDKWSKVAGCTLPISSCYLHAKHDWEPGHHHPHPFRSPSADSNVFLPLKLLIPKNIIYVCLHSQIPCLNHDPGQNHFL